MTAGEPIVHSVFLIFFGAALAATLALYARQALIVAYIFLGVLAGPDGVGLIDDRTLIDGMAHVGIIFLLFLLGLNLEFQELFGMLRAATFATAVSALAFGLAGAGVMLALGFTPVEALVAGAAAMFSSTILALKLLPTTALHHQHTGEILISVLLLQDLIAIFVLVLIQTVAVTGGTFLSLAAPFITTPALIGLSYLTARTVLNALLARFDRIQEYVFLLAIGWCLAIAELGAWLGLSREIGAFIAGIALATSPVARYLAESLKPLRDFFLVIFFFALGAGLDLVILADVALPALVFAALLLAFKPWVFGLLFRRTGETRALAREIGFRLGQISEFSLLVALLARTTGLIGPRAAHLVQAATVFSFIASSYLVVLRYPTPIAISERLRRD